VRLERGLRLRLPADCVDAHAAIPARCQAVLRCTAAAGLLGIGRTEFVVRLEGWGGQKRANVKAGGVHQYVRRAVLRLGEAGAGCKL
jgi:hypothetical protein